MNPLAHLNRVGQWLSAALVLHGFFSDAARRFTSLSTITDIQPLIERRSAADRLKAFSGSPFSVRSK